jgi:HSP20 family protein
MSVTRFEPYRDPFREFDRLLSMAASGTRAPLSMPMDVYRGEDGSYHVEADLPGADPDSVEVTVEHGVLTIQAGRTPHYGDSGQVIVAERPQGSFARQLSLGEGVDSENLTAGYAGGVLHVTIPASPKTRARRVTVTRAAGGSRIVPGAPSSRVRCPPAARAPPSAECPCTLPPEAVPAFPASASGHAGSTSSNAGSGKTGC